MDSDASRLRLRFPRSGLRRNDGRVSDAPLRYPAAPSTSNTSDNLSEVLAALRRLARLRRTHELDAPAAKRCQATPLNPHRLTTLPGTEVARGLHRIDHPPIPLANAALSFDRPEFANVTSEHLLAIDTETTGLAGGTGTRAFVIGIARWHDDAITVTQWLLTELGGEPALLAALTAALGQHADESKSPATLLSYNGKSYDLPLLRTRWRLARQPDPTQELAHLDLLHPVRRAYRGVWENCRLATVERQLLGIVREDDLPGSEAPAAFTRWLREGDAGDLVRVVEHNRQDVVSLVRLAECMGRHAEQPSTSHASQHRADRLDRTQPSRI